MKKRSLLVLAPHPDDETLGCGGTLLRARREGAAIHWVIATSMTASWSAERRAARDREIEAVARRYGFASTTRLGFPAAALETVPFGRVVEALGAAVAKAKPDTFLVPHAGDAHTDHRVCAEAADACSKWFRFPSVKKVLAYETLSETDQAPLHRPGFRAEVFVGIERELKAKLSLMSLYKGETAPHPFPRGARAVTALARVRGASVGLKAAEAFSLLKEAA